MDARYPEIEPYDHGLLDVGDGNAIYWETCGNPDGRPALVLHGGPGSGCTAGMRRYFDPAAYRIVLFDQRGCGRSTPHASDRTVSLAANTTQHLLADIERLRRHLAIDGWLIRGASWGSALALAYAEQHPQLVTALVLSGVGTGRRSEVELFTRGLGAPLPGRLGPLPRRGARTPTATATWLPPTADCLMRVTRTCARRRPAIGATGKRRWSRPRHGRIRATPIRGSGWPSRGS